MRRILEPELLDSLAPQDPDALHSRRDLRLTNQIMGNHRWLAGTLRTLLRPGEVALELGAGTGEFGLRLATQKLACDGLDRTARPPEWPAKRAWHNVDLRHFDGYADYPVIFGNLVFHHFEEAELAALGALLRAKARAIVACEPLRRSSSQKLFAAFAPLLGANRVTLHDAHLSIAAGFQDDELPTALGLTVTEWDWRVTKTMLGAYRMVALRRG